jgi:hypothetical protein
MKTGAASPNRLAGPRVGQHRRFEDQTGRDRQFHFFASFAAGTRCNCIASARLAPSAASCTRRPGHRAVKGKCGACRRPADGDRTYPADATSAIESAGFAFGRGPTLHADCRSPHIAKGKRLAILPFDMDMARRAEPSSGRSGLCDRSRSTASARQHCYWPDGSLSTKSAASTGGRTETPPARRLDPRMLLLHPTSPRGAPENKLTMPLVLRRDIWQDSRRSGNARTQR